MLDGNQWMAANLNVDTNGSFCYGDAELNCRRYGRLYTWRAAQEGCRSLGGGWGGFNALLGGGLVPDEGQYARLEEHGFYWSASETAPGSAWFYNFGKGGLSLLPPTTQ